MNINDGKEIFLDFEKIQKYNFIFSNIITTFIIFIFFIVLWLSTEALQKRENADIACRKRIKVLLRNKLIRAKGGCFLINLEEISKNDWFLTNTRVKEIFALEISKLENRGYTYEMVGNFYKIYKE